MSDLRLQRSSKFIPCPTPGCSGDARYAAPGRGHATVCYYPLTETTSTGTGTNVTYRP